MPKRTWKKVRSVAVFGNDCLLTLSDGSTAYVDADDLSKVEANNWSLGSGGVVSGLGKLQNVILGIRKDFVVDHIDGDIRNNRKANLRHATKGQNARNRSVARNNTSGFKGVSPRKDRGTWLAHITAHGKRIKIGTFPTPEQAAKAYDECARDLHGEFACLNFPSDGERSALIGKAVSA